MTIRPKLLAGAALCCLVLAGCSGPAAEPESDTGGAAEPEGAFPVSIEHAHGTTEIPAAPQRVVTLGLTDQDAVLALGVTPVAVTEWFGEQPSATWEWAQDELAGGEPTVLAAAEIDFEQLIGLDPDLILSINGDLDATEYASLSDIAPTVAQSDEYVAYGTPWQEQTTVIGRALGQEERAQELVAEVEEQFAAAAEENSQFAGLSGIMALSSTDGNYYPYGAQDARARFLESLGFETPAEITELAGDQFYGTISRERFDILNADVLVWLAGTSTEADAIRNDPLYQLQPVAQQGRDVFVADPLLAALSFGTVLSLPFAIDGLTPMLVAAADGDPATEVPTQAP